MEKVCKNNKSILTSQILLKIITGQGKDFMKKIALNVMGKNKEILKAKLFEHKKELNVFMKETFDKEEFWDKLIDFITTLDIITGAEIILRSDKFGLNLIIIWDETSGFGVTIENYNNDKPKKVEEIPCCTL